jgi:hypothetical protein
MTGSGSDPPTTGGLTEIPDSGKILREKEAEMKEDKIIPWSEVKAGDEALIGGKMVKVERITTRREWTEVGYTGHAGRAVIERMLSELTCVRRARTSGLANDDDLLTAGELRAAGRWVCGLGSIVPEKILLNVIANREVLEDGAVYRANDGELYKWDEKEYGFRAFSTTGTVLRSTPERPLKKMSL